MENGRKQKLVDLGADTLAEMLLKLSKRSKPADELVESLMTSPKDKEKRVKAKLAGLNRIRRIRPYRESLAFARELEALLEDLRAGVSDPLEGVRLVCAFYDSDAVIFEHCDDSNGYVGDVFCYTAGELFKEYAIKCEDKQAVADLVLKVNEKSGYGVRETLVKCSGECLPEPVVRFMIQTLQHRTCSSEYEERHNLCLIESLARQIKDAPLFAEVRQKAWGKLNSAGIVDVAAVYFDSGDSGSSLEWLNKIAPDETFYTYERDRLLAQIYHQTNDTEKLTELLRRNLRKYHTTGTLDELISVMGEECRAEILREEIAFILGEEKLNGTNLEFLIETRFISEAEVYLLKRTGQLNGSDYGTLLPLANEFQIAGRFLASSLVYRALLNSILERAYSKAYPHAVRYLKQLDWLAEQTDDWKEKSAHSEFTAELKKRHGRKHSFWSQYDAS